MSQIRCVYSSAPNFPAEDQAPGAVRYVVNGVTVDAVGGEPTAQEVTAFMAPAPATLAPSAAMQNLTGLLEQKGVLTAQDVQSVQLWQATEATPTAIAANQIEI